MCVLCDLTEHNRLEHEREEAHANEEATRETSQRMETLYISKAVVESHGVQVGVKSAVGKGSTFWFTLPVADATHLPAEL